MTPGCHLVGINCGECPMSATFLHSARWTAPTSQTVALRVRCVIHQLEWLRTRLSANVPTAREFATWLCAAVTSSFLRSNRASLQSLDGRSPGLRAVRRLSYTRAAVP